jgi:hypothetical protein
MSSDLDRDPRVACHDEARLPHPVPSDIQHSDNTLRILQDTAQHLHQLVAELEPMLDARQRRLLHQIRLAAETYGAVRAAIRSRSPRGEEVAPNGSNAGAS